MIDNKILDEVLPVPALEELTEQTVTELAEEGFVITNFFPGGVFNMLLMIVLRLKIEFTLLLRTILNNMMVRHASGTWLDINAANYSRVRKLAEKAQGLVTITRTSATDPVRIAKGHVFKTIKDINGEELRFFVLEDTVLQRGVESIDVVVEAEREGAKYNVPQGQISRSLIYLGEVSITNGEHWLTHEGSDTEGEEAFRERILRSWADLAQRPIADAYRNAAESVPGVLFARVDDQLPRGQGTLDVIVTGAAGDATESLLEAVRTEVDKIIGPSDNILVKSSENVTQPIELTLYLSPSVSAEDADSQATAAMTHLLSLRTGRSFNELYLADIIHAAKMAVSELRNVRVITPQEDIILAKDKVMILGEVTINIERV